MLEREVVVSLRYEATHHWPECDLEGVEFLKHPHRHEFHIKVWKSVEHNDRNVEIILLKREIFTWLNCEYGGDFGRMSCEDIAEQLIEQFELVGCEVLEDGENGAMLYDV